MKTGDFVCIRTQRPHISYLNGSVGEFLGVIGTKRDIAVVCCGRWTLNFWMDEIEAIEEKVS